MIRTRQSGFTLLELVLVLAILAIMMSVLLPLFAEPLRNAKIRGGVEQAKQIIATCDLARVKPISSVRNPTNLVVTHTYRPAITSWTDVSTLKTMLTGDHFIPPENPFGRPYLFKMTDRACLVAVELDSLIEGWEGFETEVEGPRSRIIVGTPLSRGAPALWIKNQKRTLSGEYSR